MQTATIIGPQCSSSVGSSPVMIGGYSPPSSIIYAVATELIISNKYTASLAVNVTLFNGSVDYFIAFQTPVAQGDSLVIPQKITLVNGWSVRVACNVGTVDATMCVTQYS